VQVLNELATVGRRRVMLEWSELNDDLLIDDRLRIANPFRLRTEPTATLTNPSISYNIS
jgi:predicted nucleic acid-binding protein